MLTRVDAHHSSFTCIMMHQHASWCPLANVFDASAKIDLNRKHIKQNYKDVNPAWRNSNECIGYLFLERLAIWLSLNLHDWSDRSDSWLESLLISACKNWSQSTNMAVRQVCLPDDVLHVTKCVGTRLMVVTSLWPFEMHAGSGEVWSSSVF